MSHDTFSATGCAETAAAARYLGQLSRHFAHKIAVDYRPDAAPPEAVAQFPLGTCHMRAEAGELTVAVNASSQEGLERIRHVVDSHLERFAWREKLILRWS